MHFQLEAHAHPMCDDVGQGRGRAGDVSVEEIHSLAHLSDIWARLLTDQEPRLLELLAACIVAMSLFCPTISMSLRYWTMITSGACSLYPRRWVIKCCTKPRASCQPQV